MFFNSVIFSQTLSFDTLLARGKAEFKKDYEQQDYATAVANLEAAVQLRPGSTEAQYFLGYAYSRLNAKDGDAIIHMQVSTLLKCSKAFETVIALTPKYTGEMLVLDPYSKLSSEWASMAMKYKYENKTDSVLWALKEGKKRGGFSDFYLGINRRVLDLCNKNAVLITSGDNFTLPLFYLQQLEGYRKDVSVMDISLLNATWYPEFVSTQTGLSFGLPKATVDTLQYCSWQDSLITIEEFSWTVKPSYYNQYLLRGDRLFLALLKELRFKKEIYFTNGFQENSQLSLQDYLRPLILIDELNVRHQPQHSFEVYKRELEKTLIPIEKANPNSQDELDFIDLVRYMVYNDLNELLEAKQKEQAKEVLQLLDTYASEKKYPFQEDTYKDYLRSLRDACQ